VHDPDPKDRVSEKWEPVSDKITLQQRFDWIIDLTARDARLHAFRSDLADARLKGEVAADRFVTGRPARITASVADLRKAPRPDAGVNTQALLGDDVLVFEDAEGWAWVQAERDGYVGYVADNLIGAREHAPTHVVSGAAHFPLPGTGSAFSDKRTAVDGLGRHGDRRGRNARHALCVAALRPGDHRRPFAAGR